MQIRDIIACVEAFAPLALQESYDNSGVQVGDTAQEATGVLIAIDITEELIDEAIDKVCNLIVAHHPLIFKGLKKITGSNYIERCVLKAIKNNIVLYAAHTNLDNVANGVSYRMAEKLGLRNIKVLAPQEGLLMKLATYVPLPKAELVRTALFAAGAGHIGDYSECSFNALGEGTFKAGASASPYVGEIGSQHTEVEVKVEVVLPRYLLSRVLKALTDSHPYEVPAYDIISLQNANEATGSGLIGELPHEMNAVHVLRLIKELFNVPCLKYSPLHKDNIKRIALCGGSGSFLYPQAMAASADLFVTGEIKYHDFFVHENRMILAEIGHYESEQFTKELIYDIIREKFSNFATHLAETKTNPINYI
ncbi:MAG: Nif3-like dinuclear metal center hexameric protein [Bacteroidales bacterium]